MEWHPWFAWYPVYIEDRGFVWLKTVHRRGDYRWIPYNGDWGGYTTSDCWVWFWEYCQ